MALGGGCCCLPCSAPGSTSSSQAGSGREPGCGPGLLTGPELPSPSPVESAVLSRAPQVLAHLERPTGLSCCGARSSLRGLWTVEGLLCGPQSSWWRGPVLSTSVVVWLSGLQASRTQASHPHWLIHVERVAQLHFSFVCVEAYSVNTGPQSAYSCFGGT